MADKKITALSALGTTDVAPAADLLHIIDYSASPVNKKITVANLFDQVDTNTSIYGNSLVFEVGQAAAVNSHIRVEVGSSATADGAVTINDDGVDYVNFVVKTGQSDGALVIDGGTDTVIINSGSVPEVDFTVNGDTGVNIFADGGEDAVGIGTATLATNTTLTVVADATTGHSAALNGNLVFPTTPVATTGHATEGSAVAIPITTPISYLTSNGTMYFTLAAGTQGQLKTLIVSAGTGTCLAKIKAAGGTTLHLGTGNGQAGGTANTHLSLEYQEAVLLQYLNSGWAVIGAGDEAASGTS
jgi:hypothetical protein